MWRKLSLTIASLAVGVGCQAAPAASPAPTNTPTRAPTLAIATNVPRTSTPVPQPTARPTISGQVPIGAQTRLKSGIGQVHFAIDEPAAREWSRFSLENNQRAQREMVDRALVFPVSEGTRLEVVAHAPLLTLAKVLDGPQSGRTGWVNSAYVP